MADGWLYTVIRLAIRLIERTINELIVKHLAIGSSYKSI